MLAVEVLLIVLCGLAQLIFGGGYQEGQTFKEIYETAGESGMGGGVIGGALVLALHKTVGATGSYILLLVFMILCLVCITERSFVMAVKKGSGKAYQYAREDHERRKEIRQEKKEEERLLREEQRVQGVNLHSTDLSAGRPERFTPDMAMPVTEEDLARFSADRKPEEKMETAVEREEKARAAARRDREERRAALGIPPQPEPSPVQEEKEEKKGWTTKNDPRVTPIGKFIRKTSIDELPQLFNILKGDMSLVGPRPERPQFVEKFREEIPRYMIKHQVRPGLTGWAQVNGYRGDTSIRKRIEYDLYYIENWTLGFDFKIIFLTFFKGFINKNAY